MVNYSSIFPISSGGGGSIAGFEWSEKTADFTAEANKAYYCDTALGDVLMTLPSNPAPGDEVAFLIIGANKLNITTTDKIKGAALPTDYVKQARQQYLLFVFFYVDATTGWNWDSRYDSYIANIYIGAGFMYWRFAFNGMLSELQANWDGTMKRLIAANGASLSTVSGVTQQFPSLAAISDGVVGASNGQYIGATAPNVAVIQCQFASPVLEISQIGLGAQGGGGVNYNLPTYVSASAASDGITFTAKWTKTPLTGLTSASLTTYNVP